MRRLLIVCIIAAAHALLILSPIRAAGWTVETTKLDLVAGPGRRAAYLAPDGSRFAYLNATTLCTYTLDGEKQECIDFDDTDVHLDPETVRWSPDSTRLVFSEPFLITFKDSNIWMYDTTTGQLTDLINDPTRGRDVMSGGTAAEPLTVDLAPQWSADGQSVYFVRYVFQKPRDARAAIYRLYLEDGRTEMIKQIVTNRSFSTYALGLNRDDTVMAYNLDTRGEERDGTWFMNMQDQSANFGAAPVQGTYPTTYQFSPDGSSLLVNGGTQNYDPEKFTPETSPVYTLPVSGGRQTSLDSERYVYGAGWAPAGLTIAYVTYSAIDPEEEGLFIASAPGEDGELVLSGRYFVPAGQGRIPLVWADNNTLLLSDGTDYKLVVARLKQS